MIKTKSESRLDLVTAEEIEKLKSFYSNDRSKILLQYPWFGMILMNLTLSITEAVPVAAVTYKTLYLNPIVEAKKEQPKDGSKAGKSYIELSEQTRHFLLCHEILHPALGHCSYPASNPYNHKLQNIAMDLVINRILCSVGNFSAKVDQIKEEIGGGVFISNCGNNLELGLKGHKYFYSLPISGLKDCDWPYVYEQLLKASQGENGGKLKESVEAWANSFSDVTGDPENEEGNSDNDRTSFISKVSGITDNVKSSSAGTVPGEVVAYLSAMLTPKIKWTNKLRQIIQASFVKEDFSFRNNLRKSHIAVLPQLNPKPTYNVFIALDTSGSMSDSDIKEALSELKGLRDTYSMRFTIIQCDWEISDVTTYEEDEDIAWERFAIMGRGGTTFIPPVEYVNKLLEDGENENPSLFVYATDGYGSFPAEPPYPFIWLRSKGATDKDNFPFGDVIDIE